MRKHIASHTTLMHGRDKRSASIWPAPKARVERWQFAASLARGHSGMLDVSGSLTSSSSRGLSAPAFALTRLAVRPQP